MKKKIIYLLLLITIISLFVLYYYYCTNIYIYTYKKPRIYKNTCTNTNTDINTNTKTDINTNTDTKTDTNTDINTDLYDYINNINNEFIIKKHGNNEYYLFEIDNILSSEECDDLIKYTKNKTLSESTIFNNYGNIINNKTRISKTTWFELNENDIISKCSNIAKKITNKTDNNLEKIQLVYYPVGGYFKSHYDATKNTKMNTYVTSREYTLLIYLNDVEEGGETVFPKLNLEIKPKKGKGIFFRTLDKNDEIIPESLHGGKPVIKGEKWICNNWIHNKIIY